MEEFDFPPIHNERFCSEIKQTKWKSKETIMKIKISETKSIVTELYIKANSLEEVMKDYNEDRYDTALNEALPLSISVKKLTFSRQK